MTTMAGFWIGLGLALLGFGIESGCRVLAEAWERTRAPRP